MHAIWYERQGPAADVLTLGEMDTPRPVPGELLVQVMASGVNPSDVKQRGAAPGREQSFARIVPHNDGAGFVVDAASDELRGRIGERVWLYRAQHERPFGTAAEFVTVPSAQAVPLPEGMSFAEGAGLGVPGLTAAHAVTGYGSVEGKTVLVTGAAGAVGSLAVEIAARLGATVFAIVRSPEKQQRVRDLGAHHVLTAADDAAREAIREATSGRGIDHAVDVDFTNLARFLVDVAAPEGRIASYGSARNTAELPVRDLRQKNLTLHGFNVYRLPEARQAAALAQLQRQLQAGACRPLLAETFTLAQCAAAHEAVEQGRFGKVVVAVRDEA